MLIHTGKIALTMWCGILLGALVLDAFFAVRAYVAMFAAFPSLAAAALPSTGGILGRFALDTLGLNFANSFASGVAPVLAPAALEDCAITSGHVRGAWLGSCATTVLPTIVIPLSCGC